VSRFTFLTHFGKQIPMLMKGELQQLCDNISNKINSYTGFMAWEWNHFLLDSNMDHVYQITLNWKLSHVIYAKLH